ncbi:MAG: hypothetical protein WAV41_05875 [Microgenomates group bacterium]
MDTIDPKPTDQISEDTDLAKQYQEILNQYSQELQPTPPTSADSPPSPSQPTLTLPPETISTPPHNFFKYFFYLSLAIFLVVFSMVVYSFVKTPNSTIVDNPQSVPTIPAEPTAVVSYCQTNDKNIPVGESFPAADGCNTCSCTSDLTIVCTQKACEATPTVKSTPTSKITPKLSPTAVSLKTYTNSVYLYSFEYPATWTLAVDPNVDNREFSFNLPNNEVVNGVIFKNTGAKNRSESTFKEFTLPNNYQLLVSYISGDERMSIPGKSDLAGFKSFLSTFKLTK